MATKNTVEVIIAGKVLTIAGYESVEYLHKVAAYINQKLAEIEQLEGYGRQSADFRQTLLYLNLADDYFQAEKSAREGKALAEKYETELYSLKHDQIELQLKYETIEKELAEQKQTHEEELAALRAEQEETLKKQKEDAELELYVVKEDFAKDLTNAQLSSEKEIAALRMENQTLKNKIIQLEAEKKAQEQAKNKHNGGANNRK